MQSLRGKLLISAGGLFDANFRHTVVLIGAHDADGAVGVVLNRPLERTVAETVPLLAALAPPGERLFEGGPVATDEAVLLVAVADATVLDVPVFGSVGFVTGEVSPDIAPGVHHARVFIGHAGWGAGQLDAELAARAWIVTDPLVEDVFTPEPASLWRRVLQRMGPRYAAIARIPFDPSSN